MGNAKPRRFPIEAIVLVAGLLSAAGAFLALFWPLLVLPLFWLALAWSPMPEPGTVGFLGDVTDRAIRST